MMKRKLSKLAVILIILVITIGGCGGRSAKKGDLVSVHYTGTLDDGTVFDSSVGGIPLQFTIGDGQYIAAFEQAVIGMKPGESKTFTIPSDEAYGPYDEELVVEVERSGLPADLDPQVGQQLQGTLPDSTQILALVIEVTETTVTLDTNHPLAGQNLTFTVHLVEIL